MAEILVSEDVSGPAMDALCRQFDVAMMIDLWQSPEQLIDEVCDARALIVRNQTRVSKEVIEAGKRLQVIARAGVGLDNIDTQAAADAGVKVVNTPNENAISVAELTFGLMLALARSIPHADASTKSGDWGRLRFTGVELHGKTLGLVGFGCIAQLVAERARAFGMNILAVKRTRIETKDVEQTALDDLLARSDYVSCHLPATEQTQGMLNGRCFRAMKPTAYLINTSRGEIVDEADLIAALQQNTIAGAAMDVRTIEPPASSVFNEMTNVILTPHIAAFTEEAQQRVIERVCRDVTAVLDGPKELIDE